MERFLWQDILKVNIVLLRLTGLWPSKNDFLVSDPYTYWTIFVILCATTHVSSMVLNIRFIYSDLELLTEEWLLVVTESLAIFKIAIFVTKTRTLKCLFDNMNKNIFRPRSFRQILLIRPDIRIWKIVSYTILSMSTTGAFLWAVLPILTGSVKTLVLPFPAWYPYETKNTLAYLITYFHQLCGTYFIILATYNIDLLISALMMFVGAQCDILCDDLANMDPKSFEKTLKSCMRHHKKILEFADKCNHFFNEIILALFFVGTTGLALLLFRLALVTPSGFEFWYLLCGGITVTIELFNYCWFGNKIQTKSEQITYALFESSWMQQSLANKKSMIIFGERTQLPIKLSTFKLFYLSLETFVKILRSALSYYTLLRQLDGFK